MIRIQNLLQKNELTEKKGKKLCFIFLITELQLVLDAHDCNPAIGVQEQEMVWGQLGLNSLFE